MQIKPKIDKRGWELDRLEEMRSHQDKLIEKAVKATLEEVNGEIDRDSIG